MQEASAAELSPGLDQALMNRIELVSIGRDDATLGGLLEPSPLKHRRLKNRSRRIGVILDPQIRARQAGQNPANGGRVSLCCCELADAVLQSRYAL
jgi:hypothetical protein